MRSSIELVNLTLRGDDFCVNPFGKSPQPAPAKNCVTTLAISFLKSERRPARHEAGPVVG
jgi:hypothetical protein